MTRPTAPGRQRDSTRTRQQLLVAATELFGSRGYDRTTIREIGERAGVDPALIARYFGSKAALYVDTLPSEPEGVHVADLLDPARIEATIHRVTSMGPSPILQAVVRAHDDPLLQNAASARIEDKLTKGVEGRLRERGVAEPRLRAQIAVAIVAGIALARSAGTLDELAHAMEEDVVALTVQVLGSLDEQ